MWKYLEETVSITLVNMDGSNSLTENLKTALQICLESKIKYYTTYIHKAKRLTIVKSKKYMPAKEGEKKAVFLLYDKENSNKSISRNRKGDFEIVKSHR